MSVSPRLKIIYLLTVSTVVFIFDQRVALALLGFQALLWVLAGVPAAELRNLRKSAGFMAMILVFYALFTADKNFTLLRLGGWDLDVSTAGAIEGAAMCVRLLTILAASTVVRHGIGREQFVGGLKGLGMGGNLAQLFESTLGYFEGRGGLGGGKKSRDEDGGNDKGGKTIVVKRLLKGDLSVVAELVDNRLASARKTFADSDLALIFGLTIVVVGIRFIKIVPGLPLAPGHKNLVIFPCFIAASTLTRTRFAATNIGAVSGALNFLAGFGRFGVFGILQHVLPGLAIDMLVKLSGGSRSIVLYAVSGLVAGVARVSAVLILSLLFRMPAEFYLALSPFIVSQCLFGVLSAPVSKYLVSHIKTDGA
ncbi:MAG: hypothetical protein FVQ81_07070 [Candidatus Glassbacteria bacterium]|nr:hypothetical protein [Candidatus Glassbacteria bacterium]